MTPQPRQTNLLRLLLALTVLWLLPSYLMGAVFLSQPNPWFAAEIPPDLIGRLILLPIYGAVLGAPCLVAAVIAWFALHQARLASLTLGACCGVALTVFFAVAFQPLQPGPVAAALLGGPLTAGLVWAIAYGRRAPPDLALAFS
ncbi:MAG: hypothetical protein JWR84_2606 [Caulobacter sp.]|nr:hypothetical protein [Caulobacter sp.]